MARPQHKGYQLPYLGGALTGIGLGLWLLPLLVNMGIYQKFGMVGIIFVGVALVFVGVAVGLPSRTRGRDEEEERKE